MIVSAVAFTIKRQTKLDFSDFQKKVLLRVKNCEERKLGQHPFECTCLCVLQSLSYQRAQPDVLTLGLESVSLHPRGTALKLISWVMRDEASSSCQVV